MTQRSGFGEQAQRSGPLFASLSALDAASTSTELEAARARAATDVRERAQQRRAEVACPSLRQAMQTLATPFDAKQQAAAAAPPAARTQRHTRRTSSRVDAALANVTNAADSLRDALNRKARELGHSDSATAAVAPHAVAAAPSVVAAAPSGNGSTSGLATFRDAMRGLMRQSQAQRDRDVDAMSFASEAGSEPADDGGPERESDAGPPSHPRPHRGRVDLTDLIDIEAQLEAEFGTMVSAAMRNKSRHGPSETGVSRAPSSLRSGSAQRNLPSQKSSAHSSRRNSFTDVAASLGFQLITMPDSGTASTHAPVAPSALPVPGSKARSSRGQTTQAVSLSQQRQRLSSEGPGVRDGSATPSHAHAAARGVSGAGSGTSRAAMMSRRNTLHNPSSATGASTPPVIAVPVVSSRSAANSRRSTLAPDAAGDLLQPGAERRRDLQDATSARAPPLRSVAFAASERPSALSLAASHRGDLSPSRPSTATTSASASWFGADSASAVAAHASGPRRSLSRPRTAQSKFSIHNKTTLSSFMKTKPPVFAVDMPIASARSAHSSPSRTAATAAKQRPSTETERPASAINDDDDSDDSAEEKEATPFHPEITAPQFEPERDRHKFDVHASAPSSRDRGGGSARRQTAPPGQPLLLFRGASRSSASSPARQKRYIRSTATSVNHSRAVSPTPTDFAPQPPPSRSGTVSPFVAPHPPSSHNTVATGAGGGIAEVRKRLYNGSATPAAAGSSPTGSLRPTPPKRAPQPSSQPMSRRTSFSALDLLPSFPGLSSAVSPAHDAAPSGGKLALSPLPSQPVVRSVAETETPDLPSPDPSSSKLPALDSTSPAAHDVTDVPTVSDKDLANAPSPSGEASTSSLHLAASSASSTATVTPASSSSSPSFDATTSAPAPPSTQPAEDPLESQIADLESCIKDRIREHNKLRHAGNIKADHVVALTRHLTLLDDALARENEERAQGSKVVAAKEAELADLLAQHEALQLESAQMERETRELNKRHLGEEKNLLDHRAQSHQLEQRIAPAQQRLAETRAATAAIISECASVREAFAARARKYAADLQEQKRNAETLEMLRSSAAAAAARTRSLPAAARTAHATPDDGDSAIYAESDISPSADPSNTDGDEHASSSSSGSPAAESLPSHEQRLWHSRMSVIQAATGLDDFVAFVEQLQSQPEKRAESLRQQQRLQTRLKARSAERVQLAKLLGMKRMAAVHMARSFRAAASASEEELVLAVPAPSLSELRPLLQSALSKLEAVEVKLSSAQPRGSTLPASTPSVSQSAIDPAVLIQRLQLLADRVMAARSTSKA